MGWLKPLFSLFRRKKKAKKAKDLETGFKLDEEKPPQIHREQGPSQPDVDQAAQLQLPPEPQRPAQPHVELHHPQLPSKPHSPPQPVGEQEPQLPPKPQRPAQPPAELQQPELPPKEPHRPVPQPPQQDYQVTDQEQQPKHEHKILPADFDQCDVTQPQLDHVFRPSLVKLYPDIDEQHYHWTRPSLIRLYPDISDLLAALDEDETYPKRDQDLLDNDKQGPNLDERIGDEGELQSNVQFCPEEADNSNDKDSNDKKPSLNQIEEPIIDEIPKKETPNDQGSEDESSHDETGDQIERSLEQDHTNEGVEESIFKVSDDEEEEPSLDEIEDHSINKVSNDEEKQPSPENTEDNKNNEASNGEEKQPTLDEIEDYSINEVANEGKNAETGDSCVAENEKGETILNGEGDDSFIYTIEDLDSDKEPEEQAKGYSSDEGFVDERDVLPLESKAWLVLNAMECADDSGRNIIRAEFDQTSAHNFRLPRKALARHFSKVSLTKESAVAVSDRRKHFIEINTVFERPYSFDLVYLEGLGHRIISDRPLRTIECQKTKNGNWIAEEKGRCFAIFSLANRRNVHLLAKASLCTRVE